MPDSLTPTTPLPPSGSTLDYAFIAKLQNVRPLVHLLKAIHFKERAQCVITAQGVKFSIEDSRSVQAHAYLQRQFFQDFRLADQLLRSTASAADSETTTPATPTASDVEIAFSVQLNVLLGCLTIFSGSASHHHGATNSPSSAAGGTMGPSAAVAGYHAPPPPANSGTYRGFTSLGWVVNRQGSELEFVLEENEVISVCKLATFEAEDMAEFNFGQNPVCDRLIIKSEVLRDALAELDPSSEKIAFGFYHHAPHFRLSTTGMGGSTEVNFAKDTDIMEAFFCTEAHSVTYRFNQVKQALNALVYSTKTSIRVNTQGFLSMQFMIPADRTDSCFVELLCSPLHSSA
ncbi:ssDNA endodeoxyribonuclease [Dimargaris verticillata]|uniref:SsDNA endodeoxyribonuclease n=1 Tax=Dimargaris verticillata TaxID=2761393 RepID=A0A9W8B0V3_9FUNG|nr:ssDNA endodeoxyribonuclease [Dimargaris verticillata]